MSGLMDDLKDGKEFAETLSACPLAMGLFHRANKAHGWLAVGRLSADCARATGLAFRMSEIARTGDDLDAEEVAYYTGLLAPLEALADECRAKYGPAEPLTLEQFVGAAVADVVEARS